MQDLAQELVDEIIDNVGSSSANKTDIATCGLVCRRWLRRSRIHLFSNITLSNAESRMVDLFFHFIDTSSHSLLSFAQALNLYFYGKPFDDAHIAKLAQSCSRLTTLRVTLIDHHVREEAQQMYRSLQTHIPVLGINSPSLSHLDVELYNTPGPLYMSVLIDIISALPLLEFLRICLFPSSPVDDGTPLPCFSSPGLQTLEYYGDSSAIIPFFTWILSAPILPIFKSLTLHTNITGVNEPIEVYLQRVGPKIEFLELAVWSDNRDLDIAFEVSRMVQYCCELRDLTLKTGQGASDIPTFLGTISSSRLATLRVSVGGVEVDEVLPWNLIDQALANPQFHALESFSLLRASGTWVNIFLINPELKSRMPLANARGILD
ncbi:hypothetical protein C8R44DRAFT_880627 [Mycena epipterygia]|nr:hypothetical protein C8R44DRAFT_880627 [Mycena epipterygia]